MGLQKNEDSCILGSEVISSQFGIVNLEQDAGIVEGGTIDLRKRKD